MTAILAANAIKSPSYPFLSICIPTYNRRTRVVQLVRSLLSTSEAIEIIVHVDGSIDGTFEALSVIQDSRLLIKYGKNQGKTSALLNAIHSSTGKFIMSFDDDDSFLIEKMPLIISQISGELPEGFGGFIYHCIDENGKLVGTPFPKLYSNFLKLRADDGVLGDKKEIVLASLLKKIAYDPKGKYWRAPPSLSWARIALTHDAICINESIAIKRYLQDGLTSNIRSIKLQNAYPMMLLHITRVKGFFLKRYSSGGFFFRSILGITFYGWMSMQNFLISLFLKPRQRGV